MYIYIGGGGGEYWHTASKGPKIVWYDNPVESGIRERSMKCWKEDFTASTGIKMPNPWRLKDYFCDI
jgi:hypothetical protein